MKVFVRVVWFLIIIFGEIPSFVWAAVPGLPASVDPGVISKELTPPPPGPAPPQPIAAPEEKPAAPLPKGAEQIRFKLNGIIIEGNTVYSQRELAKLFQDKIHQQISITDLQKIVQDITNYYRNNGYILTRAILPPQRVTNGVVRIRILEGYIDEVHIVGNAKGTDRILMAYGERIAQSRPLQISVMEYYLRIANEIPGAQVKAVLEASKKNVGASRLNLTTEQKRFQGYVSYDNYGTLYLGPQQITLSGNLNSIVRSGDTTRLYYIMTPRPKELKYYDISYQTPLGSQGVTFLAGGNASFTRPGLNLAPLKINGYGATYYGTLTYPLIRGREQDLTLDGGFNYLDTQVTTAVTGETIPLYTDHIRSVRFGTNYNFSDRFKGLNFIDVHYEQGLNILGATHDFTSNETSRFGANGVFNKFTTMLTRIQAIGSTPMSIYLMGTGQYSYQPLLASEQFAFGGSQMGRGYNPAEIIGDRGVGGTFEYRWQFNPGWRLLETAQPYVFYDAGVIWNLKNVAGVKQKQSITSTGGGIRFSLLKYFSGNVMLAQPLTKQNSIEAIRGRGRRLQQYYSITASL